MANTKLSHKQEIIIVNPLIINPHVLLLVLLIILSLFQSLMSSSTDTIRPRDSLSGNETLVSAGGVFELGFFGDVVSGSYYVGIWFKADPRKKPVWVANRENPTLETSGVLQIRSEDGNMIIVDRRQLPWIVNSAAVATTRNTTATLLDTGNLVLREQREVINGNSSTVIIWQSFDYPTDTFLPGMKLGWFGLNTGQHRFQLLVSWVSPQNPSHGPFTVSVDNTTWTKLTVWRGNSAEMDIGFWEERGGKFRFIFQNSSAADYGYNFSYVTNQSENYFTFSVNGGDYVSKWFSIDSIGSFDEYLLSAEGKVSSANHRLCEDSNGGNAGKCLSVVPFACENGDVFAQLTGTVIPTLFYVSGSINWGFSDCEFTCRSNCSCSAFAFVENDRLTGCRLFYGSHSDLLKLIQNGDGVVYVRGNDLKESDGKKKWKLWLAIMGPLAFLLVLIPISLWGYLQWRKRVGEQRPENIRGSSEEARLFQMGSNNVSPMHDKVIRAADKLGLSTSQKDQDLPLFNLTSIETATNYFAPANKLGEGGFGPVFKGRLLDGQEIAVKRLSKMSRQGLEEFKNEVSLISKLQHRNLVRLLGCCVEGEESILVYEYMPNKSLDSFIFDSTKRELLDWRKRLNIIEGIAQGLLYLHKYSRLRIIHRDLKSSNILLDSGMNPKISDFGMARIFADNETRVKTNRVVGTYGYMSPEYAMDGLFSEKSDVFSFGVILLEIVSGKKNIAFFETDHSLNLLGNAWHLWREGNSADLMDSTLRDSCSTVEVIRYVQLGLLCVQERAIDRPTMSDVVFMLSKETFDLPPPKEPAFLSQLSSTDAESSSSRQRLYSRNDITISEVHAR